MFWMLLALVLSTCSSLLSFSSCSATDHPILSAPLRANKLKVDLSDPPFPPRSISPLSASLSSLLRPQLCEIKHIASHIYVFCLLFIYILIIGESLFQILCNFVSFEYRFELVFWLIYFRYQMCSQSFFC